MCGDHTYTVSDHMARIALPREQGEKVFRGSRKRIRKIKWLRRHSAEFWMFAIVVLLLWLVELSWLMNQPTGNHRHPTEEGQPLSRPW
jgi:hypothetical protein